jgi:hypothetical protein
VVAVNASGSVTGKDETFTTPPWAIQSTAEPSGSKASDLPDASCTAAKECTAVGFYKNSADVLLTLAERRSGSSEWSPQTTPNPSGALESKLEGVSCTSSSACTAVGFYKNSAGTILTLAESWNGSAWTIQATPNPAGATESALRGVSCTSSSACTAVGFYKNSAGTILTLAMRWNGTAWTIQTTPNPSGNPPKKYLNDVSCASSTDCWAAGESSGTLAEGTVALLEHWDGTAWTLQTLSEPPVGIKGISCPSTTSCTAVGGMAVERWNGAGWSKSTAAAASSGSLADISCTSASACTAVGNYSNGHTVPLVERWDGSAWSLQEATDTTLVYGAERPGRFSGISCTTASACAATGYSGFEIGNSRRGLVEGHL